MPGRARHSKKFDRCVREVGRSSTADSPYAVCQSRLSNPKKGKMPAGLARWHRKQRALKRQRLANLRKGRRRIAPRRNPKGFVIVGVKGGKRGWYDGASAFMDSKASAHVFQARGDAEAQARLLRAMGPARGWRLSVTAA
jgi:hypothetical protein